MEGRAAIAIDLSPAATFITKNYCTPVDVDELQRAFEALQAAVKPEMDWLYETRCDRCDGRATTAYTVYSYVFQCPRCLERIALFDCLEIQGQTAAGKPKPILTKPLQGRHSPRRPVMNRRRQRRGFAAGRPPAPPWFSVLCVQCRPSYRLDYLLFRSS